jgi:hypothetical protein
MSTPAAAPLRPVAVNLLGVVEHPTAADWPYRIDADGAPYVPAGDGGLVLGLELGDSAFRAAADHAAPGACLVHPDPAARHALTTYACIGNQVQVRSGQAAGACGAVIGKRGQDGRVIAGFRQADLRPTAANAAANATANPAVGVADGDLLLGDLVAVTGIDARFNMGYRDDWVTVGIVVHGSSPLPGHGPGVTPIPHRARRRAAAARRSGPPCRLDRGDAKATVTDDGQHS